MNDYDEFLASDEWHFLRDWRKSIDGYKCLMCGCEDPDQLVVHHISYNPRNDINNLRTVCRKCHEDIHAFYKEFAESSQHGELAEAMRAYDEKVAEIVDKYVEKREKTLGKGGDATMLTEGHHGRMGKYLDGLLCWQPYSDIPGRPIGLKYHNSMFGVNFSRYNNKRLALKGRRKP